MTVAHKIVFTGSRSFPHEKFLYDFMEEEYEKHGFLHVIVGDCPRGLDAFVLSWCLANPNRCTYTVYRAQWRRYRSAAGPLRNEDMLAANMDAAECVGFPMFDSVGTFDCLRRAELSGMPTRTVTYTRVEGVEGVYNRHIV